MECLAPGTIQKAGSPLEVTLSIQPTLVVQNALPYEMRVLLWQHLPAPVSLADAGAPLPTASGGVEPLSRLSPVGAARRGLSCVCLHAAARRCWPLSG